nr:hypothetical protein [Tanacetum cinerariifolium]
MSNELDLLFSPMFDELLNGSSKVVSKSSVVYAADAPNQRQQPTTPLNNHTTPAPTFIGNPSQSVRTRRQLESDDEMCMFALTVVSKSSAVSAADVLNQRQHLTTPLNNHTTPAPSCQILTIAPTVISFENITQAETHAENDQVTDDEFINIFSTPEHPWTKDHPLEQVIGNLSQSVRTRRQLESDAEM